MGQKDWKIKFNHSWREGNKCEDFLTSYNLIMNKYDLFILLDLLKNVRKVNQRSDLLTT